MLLTSTPIWGTTIIVLCGKIHRNTVSTFFEVEKSFKIVAMAAVSAIFHLWVVCTKGIKIAVNTIRIDA
jgi:hypothetical protein